MNNVLQLKGRFEKRNNKINFGGAKLPANKKVFAEHLDELADDLNNVLQYWKKHKEIEGALVSVHYTRVVAKSNRLRVLLSERGKTPTLSIRGARFSREKDKNGQKVMKHIFTHFVQLSTIVKSIEDLRKTSEIMKSDFNGVVTSEITEKLGKKIKYNHSEIARTRFINIILDAYYVENFTIDMEEKNFEEETIVTIYKTNVETKKLLKKFGITVFDDRIIGGNTIRLNPDELKLLSSRAPYLISMSVNDFTKITLDDAKEKYDEYKSLIPKPKNEPVVGVIDTQFNEKVYFSGWVDYRNMLSEQIKIEEKDKIHGTAVTSIIVDGPKGNPNLDDGCGRFRVRHFGVALQGGFSAFSVLKMIREIVESNRDIKVWNLSLGSPYEIKENSISPEGAELDRIQSEYDVIFVVAGTNKPYEKKGSDMKIGSPADSLNSIVVNSVDKNNKCASYSRKGPVLSFFHKPDVSYYGGDGNSSEEKITVCVNDLGSTYKTGTSFAAPWITRKVAYLIYKMRMSREVAKALVIDSAAKWNANGVVSDELGYGVVPRRIEDVLKTPDDEIKFIMNGATEDYETYTYNLPVPVVEGKHPFYAKATLVYFPKCDRNQGVDYTSTEMDFHFGRVMTNGEKAKIKSIDNNKQTEKGEYIYEDVARDVYRKWDNVKRLCEKIKVIKKGKKAYAGGMWGISIYTKERASYAERERLPFGLVVTLKEMHGKNRIDDFVKMCIAHGWIVNKIDVENQLDIYEQAEEEIDFE